MHTMHHIGCFCERCCAVACCRRHRSSMLWGARVGAAWKSPNWDSSSSRTRLSSLQGDATRRHSGLGYFYRLTHCMDCCCSLLGVQGRCDGTAVGCNLMCSFFSSWSRSCTTTEQTYGKKQGAAWCNEQECLILYGCEVFVPATDVHWPIRSHWLVCSKPYMAHFPNALSAMPSVCSGSHALLCFTARAFNSFCAVSSFFSIASRDLNTCRGGKCVHFVQNTRAVRPLLRTNFLQPAKSLAQNRHTY